MKIRAFSFAVAAVALAGCSQAPKSPDVASNIRRGLEQANLKTVSVAQDRDKGVVTLSGHVDDYRFKQQAGGIANSLAAGEVVANQIEVVPPGARADANRVNSDLDKGIEQNLDAALVRYRMHDFVKYAVKSQVVTLTGNVDSQDARGQAEQVAVAVPNVQQVVNELQVKDQKASTSR
jgi:hyperosmotically inducible periplasmic protein